MIRAPRTSRALTTAVRCSSGNGKTAVITGSNTGIGFETAKSLAQKGYSVVLAARDVRKGEDAAARLRVAVPDADISFEQLDLASLSNVKDFANRYLDSGRPLNVLCNNAGVMAPPLLRTSDGFELQIGVNHFGHFALTLQLLPRILESPASRIVNVSSSAHYFGHMNFDDLNSERSYSAWREYGQSKLANVLFSYELAKKLPNASAATVNALHPGVVATELQRYVMPEPDKIPGWQMPFLQIMKQLVLTPEDGAKTSIHLCSSPEVQGLSGRFFDSCKPVASSWESYNTDVARRLWQASLERTELDEPAVLQGPGARSRESVGLRA